MEIRRTPLPWSPVLALILMMLLGLTVDFGVLAKGGSNQTTSQTWHHQPQHYPNQHNASQSLSDEEPAVLEPDTSSAIVNSPHEKHLTRTSVIFGLTKVANESTVSQKCHAQLRQVQRGILGKQPWAMKGKLKYIYLS